MSNTVTFTDEQFAKLIETITPQSGPKIAEYTPNDVEATRSLALELLRTCSSNWFSGNTEKLDKWNLLRNEVIKMAKEYV